VPKVQLSGWLGLRPCENRPRRAGRASRRRDPRAPNQGTCRARSRPSGSLLQEAPIHLARQGHQLMVHVEDRVQARAQKITLPAIASLSRLHWIPSANHLCTERITNLICNESPGPIAFSGSSNYCPTVVSDSISTALEIFTDDQELVLLRSRASLEAEILVLRHQVNVLRGRSSSLGPRVSCEAQSSYSAETSLPV
jgi:hypothetical protein